MPMDGAWGDWTDWSTCSKTCNSGLRIRTRKCDSPLPSSVEGQRCDGNSQEEEVCNSDVTCTGIAQWSGKPT
jgi:complement component 6